MWARRLLAVLAGLALVVAGASAATGSANRAPAASNRERAIRDARGLLELVTLPGPATPTASEPAGDGGVLAHPALVPVTSALVDQHRWWRVAEPPQAVLAFVEGHAPRGSRQTGSGATGGGRQRSSAFAAFAWPPVAGKLASRSLLLRVVRLRDGSTGVRADAQVIWIVRRPRSEQIPSGVQELVVAVARPMQAPSSAFTVTDMSKVTRVEALIDGLQTVQPGTLACPSEPAAAPVVTFTFRTLAGGGVPLAQASELDDPTAPASACNAMSFTIRGRAQTPLLAGGRTIRETERILGMTFSPRANP